MRFPGPRVLCLPDLVPSPSPWPQFPQPARSFPALGPHLERCPLRSLPLLPPQPTSSGCSHSLCLTGVVPGSFLLPHGRPPGHPEARPCCPCNSQSRWPWDKARVCLTHRAGNSAPYLFPAQWACRRPGRAPEGAARLPGVWNQRGGDSREAPVGDLGPVASLGSWRGRETAGEPGLYRWCRAWCWSAQSRPVLGVPQSKNPR